MSSLDEVIARARQPGAMSKRKQFTVARRRAIEKLRKFALANPHDYVLELIQSAVAAGASSVHVDVDDPIFTMSYVGGVLREAELGQLFDFLFASRERTDIGHLRELALGVNAAMHFRPARVTIESGDGTAAGTTRLVIHGTEDAVEIGRPDRALDGTYVRVEGLRGHAHATVVRTIENRCLSAPVPLVINGEALFGYGAMRVPRMFGCRRKVELDEGDLYGTLAWRPSGEAATFKLLTWGVWIQSREHALRDGGPFGGVICFDRLNKTIDHSGIVDDARLAELWARLLPYAERLVRGEEAGSPYGASLLDGTELTPTELRELLRLAPRVVVVPAAIGADAAARALAIGNALGAEVIRGDPERITDLYRLSGEAARLLAIEDPSEELVAFHSGPEATPPARPWLAAPVDVEPRALADVAAEVLQSAGHEATAEAVATLVGRLGRVGEVEATVYTPARESDAGGLLVEVWTTERVVWRRRLAGPHAGHVLVIRVPDTLPAELRAPAREGAPPLCEALAEVMADAAGPDLDLAARRAVIGMSAEAIAPGSTAARVALSVLARSHVVRLRRVEGSAAPVPVLSCLEPSLEVDVAELPLLRTVAGEAIGVARALERTRGTGGLLYGTVEDVPADLRGLDVTRILALDEHGEQLLIALVGEASYVRVDAREVLASHRGVVVRDIAVGLRQHPDFPLPIEGADVSGWTDAERDACERDLVAQLVARYRGLDPPRPADDGLPAWEEGRRQALRHLQRHACTAARAGAPPDAVVDLPLFLDEQGRARTPREVLAALRSPGGCAIYLGRAFGTAELGRLTAVVEGEEDDAAEDGPAVHALVADAFVAALVAPLGRLRPAFDFDVGTEGESVGDVDGGDAFIVSLPFEAEGFRGTLGVPARPVAEPAVALVDAAGHRVRVLTKAGGGHAVVGVLRTDRERWDDDALAAAFSRACDRVMEALLSHLGRIEATHDDHDRSVVALLDHAACQLTLQARPDGTLAPSVQRPLAERILRLPLFPARRGGHVGAWRVIQRFCAHGGRLDAVARELAADVPAHLRAWLAAVLDPANIAREPSRPAPAIPADVARDLAGATPDVVLGATLAHHMQRLRPDGATRPLRFWVTSAGTTPYGDDAPLLELCMTRVDLNGDHWLVRRAREQLDEDPEPLAWLLLACYAHINDMLDPVVNEHERDFQRRVLAALDAGELRPVAAV